MRHNGRRSREGKRQSAFHKVEAWPEHEEKYRINRLQYQELAAELSAVMDPDPYNGTWGYPVYTLYFDDWDDRGYFDKADGLDDRERVRLRFYPSGRNNATLESRDFSTVMANESGAVTHKSRTAAHESEAAAKIFLEVKRRKADRRNKERLLIRAEEAQALLRGSSDFLDAYACGEARRIAQAVRSRPLRAAALVAYRRRAFVHRMNGIRVTLDEDIRCCPGSFIAGGITEMVSPCYVQGIMGGDGWTQGKAPDGIYMAELPWIPLEMGEVLEVKYKEYLFAWLRELLGRYPLIKGTCSKYMEAREHDGILI